MLKSEFIIIVAPQAPFSPLVWDVSESKLFWCCLFKNKWNTSDPVPFQVALSLI